MVSQVSRSDNLLIICHLIFGEEDRLGSRFACTSLWDSDNNGYYYSRYCSSLTKIIYLVLLREMSIKVSVEFSGDLRAHYNLVHNSRQYLLKEVLMIREVSSNPT